MSRSVPLSIRISDDDAAFLAAMDSPNAKTPSEKMRAILAAARRRHEGANDFAGCAEVVEDMLRPGLHRLREAQREASIRSDLVMRLYERMPELMAELVTSAPAPDGGPDALKQFEAAVADQVFAMIEEVLDMGLTSRSRSYNPNLVKEKLPPILEVVDLIRLSRQHTKGTSQ